MISVIGLDDLILNLEYLTADDVAEIWSENKINMLSIVVQQFIFDSILKANEHY